MSAAFADRASAGRALAQRLLRLALPAPIVVLALPRGGVPIGAEVARALAAPLDLLLVRKIGAPWQRELAVAAVVDGQPPDVVLDDETMAATGVDRAYVDAEVAQELQEIERRPHALLFRRFRHVGVHLPDLIGADVHVGRAKACGEIRV